jgi:hypothetical protein
VGLFPSPATTLPLLAQAFQYVHNLAAVGIILKLPPGSGLKIQERSQTIATVDLRRRGLASRVSALTVTETG